MKIEIENEFSESTPNSSGIPSKDKNSKKLKKVNDSWIKEVNKNRGKDFSKLPYWEKASKCTAL